jgi:hypothetical protein
MPSNERTRRSGLPSLHWIHAAKLVSKMVVSTDPGRVEDPINLLLRERSIFRFLNLS